MLSVASLAASTLPLLPLQPDLLGVPLAHLKVDRLQRDT